MSGKSIMPRKTRRSVEQIERDARAVDLRRRHLTYRQIAAELGLSSTSRAHEAVQRGLMDAIREPADEVRNMELQRLDELGRTAWRVLHDRHFAVSAGGRIPLHPETGRPLIDDGPTLAAIDRLLKISDARRKLLGLDAPTQVTIMTDSALDAEIRKLTDELAASSLRGRSGGPDGVLDGLDAPAQAHAAPGATPATG